MRKMKALGKVVEVAPKGPRNTKKTTREKLAPKSVLQGAAVLGKHIAVIIPGRCKHRRYLHGFVSRAGFGLSPAPYT